MLSTIVICLENVRIKEVDQHADVLDGFFMSKVTGLCCAELSAKHVPPLESTRSSLIRQAETISFALIERLK